MLGKLIKNEFKFTAHMLIPVYSALAIAVIMTTLSFITKSELMSVLSSLVLVIIGLVLIVVTFVYIVINFNKSLFGNQGYLSMSLPVKSSSLLSSKIIVSFVWILISYLMLLAIMFGVYTYTKGVATVQYGEETVTTIKDFLALYTNLPSTANIIKTVVVYVLSVFSGLLVLIMNIYFAISAANTKPFQHRSTLWAIVVFFAVRVLISNVLVKYASKALPVFMVSDSTGLNFLRDSTITESVFSVNITQPFVQIIMIVALFFATNYLLKTKVNVK
ncbi:MAG TPA: hypothetical protein VFD52_00485 [Clostridia bacterium]|nr:hypothetical protein [Clostridia bacterium]